MTLEEKRLHLYLALSFRVLLRGETTHNQVLDLSQVMWLVDEKLMSLTYFAKNSPWKYNICSITCSWGVQGESSNFWQHSLGTSAAKALRVKSSSSIIVGCYQNNHKSSDLPSSFWDFPQYIQRFHRTFPYRVLHYFQSYRARRNSRLSLCSLFSSFCLLLLFSCRDFLSYNIP